MTRRLAASLVMLAGLLLAGCGAADEPSGSATEGGAGTEQQVLLPTTGTPVVTFSGLVNGGEPLAVDLDALNALRGQSVTVLEPFLKQSMTFTGVGFADLLDAVTATGASVTLHALDDYEVTFDAAVLREPGVLLATGVDGNPIDAASGGPVRLIFPASSQSGEDTDLWVWSIDQITVE